MEVTVSSNEKKINNNFFGQPIQIQNSFASTLNEPPT
jgi:hypothetical protein